MVCSKIQERDELKELLNTKRELEALKNSPPIHTAKNEKLYSEENTKGMAEQSFDKEIMGVTYMCESYV